MRFYTKQECETWLADRQRRKPDSVPGIHADRIRYPSEPHRFLCFAHSISGSLAYGEQALLWITEWGIWPSSENWHLYYKLRQTYDDQRLLDEAPGHLFLEDEVEDLTSFLQITMLNGWGGYVLTHANHVNAFFSDDEYIEFFAERAENLTDVRATLDA